MVLFVTLLTTLLSPKSVQNHSHAVLRHEKTIGEAQDFVSAQ
jgi:hypothetical protein